MSFLDELQTFVVAAELGSFARAGRQLALTASGVGKAVSRLERELGVRLTFRTTRQQSLTEEGKQLFERCRPLLAELEAAREEIGATKERVRGNVRLSAPVTLAKRVLVPALPRFFASHPAVRLDLRLSDRKLALIEEGIDVALRVGSVQSETMAARRVGGQRLLLVASPSYLSREPIRGGADLLRAGALVARFPSSGRLRPWLLGHGQAARQLKPRPLVTCDDGEALVAAAEASLGVCQVPEWLVSEELVAGSLVEILPELRPPVQPIWLVSLGKRSVPARVRALSDFLRSLGALSAAEDRRR